MSLKLLLIFIFVFLGSENYRCYGQSAPSSTSAQPPTLLPQRVPASPTAAALERYALMPVNESSGTPTINVPLYTIQCGSLSVPLSLSYHASGVRVADIASWVGLGWSLNAGGVITRVVRGMPDEEPNGFREKFNHVPLSYQLNPVVGQQSGVPNADYYLLDRVAQHREDYEPDLYAFNFGGHSGYFMQDTAGVFKAFPLQALRVVVTDSAITLTDEQGVHYAFNDREYSRTQAKLSVQHISAWYLSQIISADQADTVRFMYERESIRSKIYSISQQISIVSSIYSLYDGRDGGLSRIPQDDYKEAVPAVTYLWTKRLQRITFRGGTVSTVTRGNRLDGIGDESLRSLHIVSRNGQDTLKRVVLYHSYFNQATTALPDSLSSRYLRLRLDSVVISSRAADVQEPPYRFTYNGLALPDRLTGSRDYWGYANNGKQGSAFGLIPTTTVASLANVKPLTVGGGDRKPNPAYVQAGILTQIRYPSGGKQTFTYEPNTITETYQLPVPRFTHHVDVATGPSGEEVTNTVAFEVTAAVTQISCQIGGFRTSNPNFPKNDAHFSVHNLTLNTTVSWATAGNSPSLALTPSLALPPGKYELIATARGEAGGYLEVSYQLQAPATYGQRNAIAGGVRIRTEQLQAASRGLTTFRRYYYQTPGTTWSSGKLVNESPPLYVRTQLARVEGAGNPNCVNQGSVLCTTTSIIDVTYTVISSNSLGELEGQDQVVSYQAVTVLDSSSTKQTTGRTVSTYSTATESATNEKPFPPKILTSWKRGNLLTQLKYATAPDGRDWLVTKLVHQYTTLDSITFLGFIVAPDATFSGNTLLTMGNQAVPFAYRNTRQQSGWQHVTQTQLFSYALGDTSAYHLTTTAYSYGNTRHCQPTLVETILSDGQRQQMRSRYAADYDVTQVTDTSPAPARALRELVRNHAVAQLVEQTSTRLTRADTLVTQSQLHLGRVLAPGVVVPAQQLAYQVTQPLAWRSFRPFQLQAGSPHYDPHYALQVVFDRYDAQRQLVQAHMPGGSSLSYLWDSRTGQPLAKASNALVTQLACTSFEPGAAGRWTYDMHLGIGQRLVEGQGHSGRWAYRLDDSFGVSRDSLPAGDYELSYWRQNAATPLLQVQGGSATGTAQTVASAPGGWQQQRIRLHFPNRGSVRLGGGGTSLLLDDVVLQPVGAQLTSYTYDALRGMTSQTDATGRTVTYEYDGLGRLVRTRDEQGRILSQQQYHYAGK
ncbi:hypothetical protein GO988_23015 [Hymenobacter sp. HMF4947]|uniref:RHS repeat protein n=1 Tax=Hymenobacter ginkgonis TaxID=2682976 RepID=A0A7K1TLG9_9BACT|nr:RHS repeat domain-containing protein [Hymenobacter ginkgonis]MVN79213.1 hypothetical protein [Hymenobacter ginkgonis]